MKLSKQELTYFVGKIMGDGHIDSNNTVKLVGQLEDLTKIKTDYKNKIQSNFKIYQKWGYACSYYMNLSTTLGKN